MESIRGKTTDPSIMFVGGFLGAGKTTAIRALGALLARKGMRVAAVTNDQAQGLVDTAFLRRDGLATLEVAGSCFCCNFDGLYAAVQQSLADGEADVILAEPVGSCTDIVATVIRPLRRFMRENLRVLPFSVLVEPRRWLEFSGETQGEAPGSMGFLFRKQLEEADLVVLTKSDTLDPPLRERLLQEIRAAYPDTTVVAVSSRNGEGLEMWLDSAMGRHPGERWLRDLDYGEYAEAEADMGWLNARLDVRLPRPAEAAPFAAHIAEVLRRGVADRGGSIGHLKILLSGRGGVVKCGVTHVEEAPQWEGEWEGPEDRLEVTVNVRATLSPEALSELLYEGVAWLRKEKEAEVELSYCNTLRPAPPSPTYRYAGDV